MNPELRELYQEIIVDHGRRPRNFKKLEGYTHQLEGFNPLCGDRLTLYAIVSDDIIQAASFEGVGCAISMASASLMTEVVIGKTLPEAEQIFEQFHTMVTESDSDTATDLLGKLTILSGVKEFPARVKCATLAWHTLHNILIGKHETAKTE